MTLDPTDIQGFILRGYTFPVARFFFLELSREQSARALIGRLIPDITTGERWDKKPISTLNIAFTYQGLAQLEVPEASLQSFPVEFVQGMKARASILCDTGKSAPENWDPLWHGGRVHAWLSVYAQSPAVLESRCSQLQASLTDTGAGRVVGTQDAAALAADGRIRTKEHFGYTDGFGNPDYLGVDRNAQPGQGKLMADGSWAPLATGELLLGYPDEAGELPVAPVPHQLANNGTFMVYRKLHQNVATFRRYLREKGSEYRGGEEKLAAKLVGRWRDGTPLELSPDHPDPGIVDDDSRNVNFRFGYDLAGTRCPIGAHIRRAHPRDAFGFHGRLVDRRRISRRGLPYGSSSPDGPGEDTGEHGIVFMALNASIFRQFEFVQQQWMQYGNDAHQGNDRDPLLGNHQPQEKFVVQGTEDPTNPPFICGGLPYFV